MSRDQAEIKVRDFVASVGGYVGVSEADAKQLLEPRLFRQLASDPMRRAGPAPGYFYPWNIIDYLSGYVRPGYVEPFDVSSLDCEGVFHLAHEKSPDPQGEGFNRDDPSRVIHLRSAEANALV